MGIDEEDRYEGRIESDSVGRCPMVQGLTEYESALAYLRGSNGVSKDSGSSPHLSTKVEHIPFPNKQYQIIYADPPWSFSSKELQTYGGKRFTSMDKHYPTQSKDWIKNLPVASISQKDCAIFMWSTDAHLGEAIETMESWGFKYVTVAFIWEKLTATGKTVANLGAWTMKNYEICLFGTKGAMLKHKKANNVYQKVAAERTKHSKKPEAVRKNIETLFGDLPRIELFAREKHEGWDVWGNEV